MFNLSNHRIGVFAEWWAMLWLWLRGYRIVARRFRCYQGEIDLIVFRHGTIVFAEIKIRHSVLQLAYALPDRQSRRIRQAAALFLQRHPTYRSCDIRFDLLLLDYWGGINHLENAF
jgi:putative endonuclease